MHANRKAPIYKGTCMCTCIRIRTCASCGRNQAEHRQFIASCDKLSNADVTAEMIFRGIEQALRLHQATMPVQLRLRVPVRLHRAIKQAVRGAMLGDFVARFSTTARGLRRSLLDMCSGTASITLRPRLEDFIARSSTYARGLTRPLSDHGSRTLRLGYMQQATHIQLGIFFRT